MLPNGGITGQFKMIMSGLGMAVDSDNTNTNTTPGMSDIPVVGQYWTAGIIIVASLGMILAGGLLKGGSPIKLAAGVAKDLKGGK